MRSSIILALFLGIFSVSAFGQKTAPKAKSSKTNHKKVEKKSAKNFVCQLPASVTRLSIDKTELTTICQKTNGSENIPCQSESQLINVVTIAVDFAGLDYLYTVSAGKIVGSGANVQWDLSGVKPGTYIITAAVDSGQGVLGQTRTQTVKIIECPNCH